MTVTQDYKILTLTSAEYQAVRQALFDEQVMLKAALSDRACAKGYRAMLRQNLSATQTAIAKVLA